MLLENGVHDTLSSPSALGSGEGFGLLFSLGSRGGGGSSGLLLSGFVGLGWGSGGLTNVSHLRSFDIFVVHM